MTRTETNSFTQKNYEFFRGVLHIKIKKLKKSILWSKFRFLTINSSWKVTLLTASYHSVACSSSGKKMQAELTNTQNVQLNAWMEEVAV